MIARCAAISQNLRVNCAGSRPATKSLVATTTYTTTSSTNLRSISVLPIAGLRSSPPISSIASANRVQPTSDTHRQRPNPHSI